MGLVYLINEWKTDNYKIGVTKSNSNKRKLQLQTGNANELIICRVFKTKNPYKLEKLLHLYYYKDNIINEWFQLTDEQVLDFLNICSKYNSTINFLKEENYFF